MTAPSGPHLLLSGFYGVGNLGDELMLQCLARWMARASARVTVLSESPGECERTSGLPAIRNVPLLGQWAWYDAWIRGSAWRLIRRLREYDGYVGGGGDVLRDDRGWRHLTFAAEKFAVARLLGRPWYVLNAGIGEPGTRYGRRVLQLVLERARLVVVRDHSAYAVASRIRHGSMTYFAGDIVLELPRLFPAECAAPVMAGASSNPYVLVCLRGNPNIFGRLAMTEQRVSNLALALDVLASRGYRAKFLPFQQHQLEDDGRLHREVASKMRCRDAVTFLDWTVDIPAIAAHFRGAALVVAMRLHAAVLAEAFGAHAAVLPYDRKLFEFARQRGLVVVDAVTLDRAAQCRARLEDALAGARAGLCETPPHDWLDIEFPSARLEEHG